MCQTRVNLQPHVVSFHAAADYYSLLRVWDQVEAPAGAVLTEEPTDSTCGACFAFHILLPSFFCQRTSPTTPPPCDPIILVPGVEYPATELSGGYPRLVHSRAPADPLYPRASDQYHPKTHHRPATRLPPASTTWPPCASINSDKSGNGYGDVEELIAGQLARVRGPAAAMRIPIRVQLGGLLLLASLIGLAVLSIAVWVTVHDFVLNLRSSRLALTATLKAAQLASNLSLMQTSVGFVSTRVLVQRALQRYNQQANNTAANWAQAYDDMQAALGGGASGGQSMLIQSMLFPVSPDGPGGPYSLLNITGQNWIDTIPLPYTYPNGTNIFLGANDSDAGNLGFPPMLYPNFTYTETAYNSTLNISTVTYEDDTLGLKSSLLLGPWSINETFSLASITVPIINNTSNVDVLGWLTVVMDASLIDDVIVSQDGLGKTGQTLLIGPTTNTNLFTETQLDALGNRTRPDLDLRFVIPVPSNDTARHPDHTANSTNPPFPAASYSVLYNALQDANRNKADSAGGDVYATDEMGKHVSVGYAMPITTLVDWVVVVEQSRSEVWRPIHHLRNVILACVFATVGAMAIISFPLAHFASLPILRLRAATSRSIEPPGASRSSLGSFGSMMPSAVDGEEAAIARKEGFNKSLAKWKKKRAENAQWRRDERRKRGFRIPGKVKERKNWIKDELSDLTYTFNEMSDELMMQYTKLEERVQQRTAELELSKKAAEAANESKTLFIANISHELKTPLNGILGMCAVCMQEDDPIRLKRSLGIIYKSGDLLLNLLTDLLTFSKNQVGQHLSLDEKEFRLRDISSQTLAIFDKQAQEGQIDLRVEFEGVHDLGGEGTLPELKDLGPAGTGRLRDMILWGDMHRILQVVINLVSNSLKFTPPGGSVVLTVRCLSDVPPDTASRKPSVQSKQSRQSRRPSARHKSSDGASSTHLDTANAINAKDRPFALAHERAASPPPGQYLYFEFEVADTGPGIPEDQLNRIFEPFVQGDLGLSKKYGGTGLGLSICSQLAQLMRGSMSVRSTVGLGSTFAMKIPLRHLVSRADSSASSAVDVGADSVHRSRSFSNDESVRTPARSGHAPLDPADHEGATSDVPARTRGHVATSVHPDSQHPARLVGLSQPFFAATSPIDTPSAQSAAMEQITAEATRGGRIRVLVAEDNKVNQEVVLRMLKLEDIYDVTVAKDGQEALDLVKESMSDASRRPFNLIFMDVQMPNVDGLQSTRLIREIGYQAPIVALTAFSEESNIKDCLESGMNYFL